MQKNSLTEHKQIEEKLLRRTGQGGAEAGRAPSTRTGLSPSSSCLKTTGHACGLLRQPKTHRGESAQLTRTAPRPDVTSLHHAPLPGLPPEGGQEGRERFVDMLGESWRCKSRREGSWRAPPRLRARPRGPSARALPQAATRGRARPAARHCRVGDWEALARRSPWKRRARWRRSGWAWSARPRSAPYPLPSVHPHLRAVRGGGGDWLAS